MAELAAKEEMERRIKTGRCDIPRQIIKTETDQFVQYVDTQNHRSIGNPMEEEVKQKFKNPWSDVEKCIFLDRWLQYPKNFRKIATFLSNKNTADCVRYYYDSKKSIPYKRALKEHWTRRKKRLGESWNYTREAVQSVGAVIVNNDEDEQPKFLLPTDDNSFSTINLHPKSEYAFKAFQEIEELESAQRPQVSISRSTSQESNLSSSGMKRKAIDDGESNKGRKIGKGKGLTPVKQVGEKKGSQKWTEVEHKSFLDAYAKHGKFTYIPTLETSISSLDIFFQGIVGVSLRRLLEPKQFVKLRHTITPTRIGSILAKRWQHKMNKKSNMRNESRNQLLNLETLKKWEFACNQYSLDIEQRLHHSLLHLVLPKANISFNPQ